MPESSWALVDGEPAADTTLADALVEAIRERRATDQASLLDRLGTLVRAAPPSAAFAATADNVAVAADGSLRVVRALRGEIDPLPDDAPARHARVCLHLAAALVERAVIDEPHLTVDALALRLGGRCGLVVDEPALGRARAHEAAEHAACTGVDAGALLARADALGASTVLDAVAAGTVAADDVRLALAGALGQLDAARQARDVAEAAAVELAATRALAQSLGEELERDEWIRARLRNAKSTVPARALIAARKRVLHRG
jgi:hypothetical protein